MVIHNLSATATDTLGATDSATASFTDTTTAPLRVVTRSHSKNRIEWDVVNHQFVTDQVRGPVFSDAAPETSTIGFATGPITVSQMFFVDAAVRFTGCRIYKAPNATGTNILVKLWRGTASGVHYTTGTEIGSFTIPSWVVDNGGWQQITFAAPINLVPNEAYFCGFHSQDGIYAHQTWIQHGEVDRVAWPIIGKFDKVSGSYYDGNVVNISGTLGFPTLHNATDYYIDVQVEWDSPYPAYPGGAAYYDQFSTNPVSRYGFPIGVQWADPPYLEEYFDTGINTLMMFPLDQDYIDTFNTIGHDMDLWPQDGGTLGLLNGNYDEIFNLRAEQPLIWEQMRGIYIHEEPDMVQNFFEGNEYGSWYSPTLLRDFANYIKSRDSTLAIFLNLGRWSTRGQSFNWAPSGASALQVAQYWREYAEICDIISNDDHVLSADENPSGARGIWTYPAQVGRTYEHTDGRRPQWIYMQLAGQTAVPLVPEDVRKATWASLIAGARGITFFDHQFGGPSTTQDFAKMLHTPALKSMVTALCTRIQSLSTALLNPDLALVTAHTSSNKTSGPMGGTFGVPMHFCTREDATYEYLFAMGIRPGATTATFTIPTWTGLTVAVLDESRTVTVNGSGVLTDTFAADYTTHLYRRTK